jgi:hypothetical protein
VDLLFKGFHGQKRAIPTGKSRCRRYHTPHFAHKIEILYGRGKLHLTPTSNLGALEINGHAAMEAPQSLENPQSPHVPSLLLRNICEGEVWVRDGSLPSDIQKLNFDSLSSPQVLFARFEKGIYALFLVWKEL